MKSGIYCILNKENQMRYIGQSVDIPKRFLHHKNRLRSNKHRNIHLQRAWNKYGEEAFEFQVIQYVDTDLNYREYFWWLFFKPENCYNEATPGQDSPMSGKKHSEDTKKKISESKSGEKHHYYGVPFRLGFNHSNETKKKISEKLFGRQLTDEWKKNIALSNGNRPFTLVKDDKEYEFYSAVEASNALGLCYSSICRLLNGKIKSLDSGYKLKPQRII